MVIITNSKVPAQLFFFLFAIKLLLVQVLGPIKLFYEVQLCDLLDVRFTWKTFMQLQLLP